MPSRAVAVVDEGPSKAWLDSYADAMTLLLAFFVLLYAFSITDEAKFAEFKYGVEQAFSFASPAVPEGSGFLDEGLGINENAGQLAVIPSDVQNEIDEILEELSADQQITPNEVEELKEALESQLGAQLELDVFDVALDPRGVVVTLDERLLFNSGSALIESGGVNVIGAVAQVLAGIDNTILVEGHTDSVPTNGTQWPTNWELSTSRATAVLRVMNEQFGIAGPRLAAVGHADTVPVGDNSTSDGRQANRRTELLVLVEADAAEVSAIPIADDIADDIAEPLVSNEVGGDAIGSSSVDITGFESPVFNVSTPKE